MNEIDKYLENLAPTQRAALERVRNKIKELVPDAVETISYAMPTFKFMGKNMIHFAAFKNHMSIFPTDEPIDQLKEKLKDFRTAKGTIQFTESNPVPDNLLEEIIITCRDRILNK